MITLDTTISTVKNRFHTAIRGRVQTTWTNPIFTLFASICFQLTFLVQFMTLIPV